MSPNRPSPDQLRDLLRKGDPAAGDPGLSPDQIGRMRRIVLDATSEPHRRLVWIPALAGVAGVAAMIALLVALGPWRTGETTAPPAPERIASVPVPSVSPAPPALARVEPPVRMARREPTPPHSRHLMVHRPEPVATVAHAETDHEARQVQFETPGGTRVIWILNPTTE